MSEASEDRLMAALRKVNPGAVPLLQKILDPGYTLIEVKRDLLEEDLPPSALLVELFDWDECDCAEGAGVQPDFWIDLYDALKDLEEGKWVDARLSPGESPITVWEYGKAPQELQISSSGGDEDWVAEIPPAFSERYLSWLEEDRFGNSVEELDHPTKKGWKIRIAGH